jgi:hypothetical protein
MVNLGIQKEGNIMTHKSSELKRLYRKPARVREMLGAAESLKRLSRDPKNVWTLGRRAGD